jgi:hypothetical protein
LTAEQPVALQELFALEEVVSKKRKALVFAITVNCLLSRLMIFRAVTSWLPDLSDIWPGRGEGGGLHRIFVKCL